MFFFFSHFSSWSKIVEKWNIRSDTKGSSAYDDIKKEKEVQVENDLEFYNTALRTKDRTLCEKIKNISEKSRCFDMVDATQALEEKNKQKCQTLSNTWIAERCKDNITFAQAESSFDRNACNDIFDKNIYSQCREMIDLKNLAIRSLSGSVDEIFCDSLTDEIKNTCRSRMTQKNDREMYASARVTKTLSDCDAIEKEDIRLQCRDTIIFESALREKDISLCSDISDLSRAKYCQNSLSVNTDIEKYQSIISGNKIEDCRKLDSEALEHQCHDVILISQVRSQQDPQLCDMLYNTWMLVTCRGLIHSR